LKLWVVIISCVLFESRFPFKKRKKKKKRQ
jgi:hypothetical protein